MPLLLPGRGVPGQAWDRSAISVPLWFIFLPGLMSLCIKAITLGAIDHLDVLLYL